MKWTCGFFDHQERWVELWTGTEGEVRAFHAGITMHTDFPNHYKVRAINPQTDWPPTFPSYRSIGGRSDD